MRGKVRGSGGSRAGRAGLGPDPGQFLDQWEGAVEEEVPAAVSMSLRVVRWKSRTPSLSARPASAVRDGGRVGPACRGDGSERAKTGNLGNEGKDAQVQSFPVSICGDTPLWLVAAVAFGTGNATMANSVPR